MTYVGGGSEKNPLWKRSRGKATARNPTHNPFYMWGKSKSGTNNNQEPSHGVNGYYNQA